MGFGDKMFGFLTWALGGNILIWALWDTEFWCVIKPRFLGLPTTKPKYRMKSWEILKDVMELICLCPIHLPTAW
jgi:hypothetical protein